MFDKATADAAYAAGYTNALMQLQTHIRQFDLKDIKRVLDIIGLMNTQLDQIIEASNK